MSDSQSDVDALRERCEKLEEEVGRLREAVQFLVHCKQTEPTFAYYNWLVEHDVFDQRRARLEHVMGVLESRLEGRATAVPISLSGILDGELYDAQPPTRESARRLLMQAIGTDHPATIDGLLNASGGQMPNRVLVLWWTT